MVARTLFILCCAVLSVAGVRAQEVPEADWQVVLYHEISGEFFINASTDQYDRTMTRQLYFIGRDGLRETVTLPSLFGVDEGGLFGEDAFLSPDIRYTVIGTTGQTAQVTAVGIVDLTTMEVISTTINRYGKTRFYSNFHGTQFAYSYEFESYSMHTDVSKYSNGLVTVDAATGEITAQMRLEDILKVLGNDFDFEIEDLVVASWQEDGVHFLPSCRNCSSYHETDYGHMGTDIYAGAYYVWNPEDNTITRSADDYHLDLAETLSGTGEILQLGPLDGYQPPHLPRGETYYAVGERNTVRYWRDDDTVIGEGSIVYYGGEDANFASVEWVLDGNAFLAHDPSSGISALVFRDGTTQTVEGLHGETVVGTPDGWLTVSRTDGVFAYTVIDGTITETEIMQFAESSDQAPSITPLVAYMPDLGATAAAEGFPGVLSRPF